jgi:hypothetical protein
MEHLPGPAGADTRASVGVNRELLLPTPCRPPPAVLVCVSMRLVRVLAVVGSKPCSALLCLAQRQQPPLHSGTCGVCGCLSVGVNRGCEQGKHRCISIHCQGWWPCGTLQRQPGVWATVTGMHRQSVGICSLCGWLRCQPVQFCTHQPAAVCHDLVGTSCAVVAGAPVWWRHQFVVCACVLCMCRVAEGAMCAFCWSPSFVMMWAMLPPARGQEKVLKRRCTGWRVHVARTSREGTGSTQRKHLASCPQPVSPYGRFMQL